MEQERVLRDCSKPKILRIRADDCSNLCPAMPLEGSTMPQDGRERRKVAATYLPDKLDNFQDYFWLERFAYSLIAFAIIFTLSRS
jgi:hypothetical protein